MKLAIMQPYIFPYIGYFQLVNAVDKFVFYDDVNFIKGGWISRNKIMANGKEMMFTIPLTNISSFKPICQTEVNTKLYPVWRKKFLRSVQQNYNKTPFFNDVYPIIEKVFIQSPTIISELAIDSVIEVANYLGVNTEFEKSSQNYKASKGKNRIERIVSICKLNSSKVYINPIGGQELYAKKDFNNYDIDLFFINNTIPEYKQFEQTSFISGLSIIDVLMFNSKSDVRQMLNDYSLK